MVDATSSVVPCPGGPSKLTPGFNTVVMFLTASLAGVIIFAWTKTSKVLSERRETKDYTLNTVCTHHLEGAHISILSHAELSERERRREGKGRR